MSYIVSLLREESSMTDARGVDYVNYYGMLNAKKRCRLNLGHGLDALFSSNTFLKLQAGGAVSTFVFEAYLTRYAEMLRIFAELSAYDAAGMRMVTAGDLEKYVESHQLFELQRMNFLDVPNARRIAVRKFVFRHAKNNQILIEDIASSATIREMFEIKAFAKAGRFNEINPFSWFSKQSVESVINAFRVMDPGRRGYVVQDDLVNFEGTKFSALFIRMVFETYITPDYSDERRMGLIQFADFVLAWRDRSSSAAVSYFFNIFDVDNKGFLNRVDIHMFFKEICEMWVVARNEGWEDERLCENVIAEIFDMARSNHSSHISKSDLTKCGKAYQIIGMMADMMEFWKFENGEAEDEDLQPRPE